MKVEWEAVLDIHVSTIDKVVVLFLITRHWTNAECGLCEVSFESLPFHERYVFHERYYTASVRGGNT